MAAHRHGEGRRNQFTTLTVRAQVSGMFWAFNAGILQRYDEELDAAFEQAPEQGDVTPLVQTVKR